MSTVMRTSKHGHRRGLAWVFCLGASIHTLHAQQTAPVTHPPVSQPQHALTLSSGLPAATLGREYSQAFQVLHGTEPLVISASGTLPRGMAWSHAASGILLSGTPAETGEFPVTLAITDASGQHLSQAETLVVQAHPQTGGNILVNVTESLHAADTVNASVVLKVTVNEALATTDKVGAYPPIQVSVTEALNTADALTNHIEAVLQITTAANLPPGTYNNGYIAQLSASGGTGTGYVYALYSGSLPPGLALSTSGQINGTDTSYGSYAFTIKVTDSLGNVATKAMSLTIASGATGGTSQTITAGTLPSVTYAANTFSLSSTASSGLPVIYNVVSGPASGSGPFTPTGAGLVTIQIEQPGNATYAAAPAVSVFLIIGKAPLTVTPDPVSRVFDGRNPTTDSYTLTGFVHGDTQTTAAISGTAAFTSPAVGTSPPGAYQLNIVPSSLFATNYTFVATVQNTLTITGGAPQSLIFPFLPHLTPGQTFHLSAYSTSGYPVTYTPYGGCTVSGNILTVTAAGGGVTARQTGNSFYAAATPVVRAY